MSESTRIIQVLIGHESQRLKEPTPLNHTHQWTLFVRPTNSECKEFEDNQFISKVKFKLHESFPNPVRVVKNPPFSLTETGYASFSTVISIYMNLPNQSSHKIQYELNLSLDEKAYHSEVQKLNIRATMPQWFIDLVNKYCLKKKSSKRKSSIDVDEKSPPEKKTKKGGKDNKDELSSRNMAKQKEMPNHHNKDRKSRDNTPVSENSTIVGTSETNTKDQEILSPATPSPKMIENGHDAEGPELIRNKIMKIEDQRLLYKICEVLLKMKSSKLAEETLCLSFDLSSASPTDLAEISKLIAKHSTR